MTIQEVKNIISTKIIEHEREIDACKVPVDVLQDRVYARRDVVEAQKLMILKDKIMFHRACLLQLKDILEAIDDKTTTSVSKNNETSGSGQSVSS